MGPACHTLRLGAKLWGADACLMIRARGVMAAGEGCMGVGCPLPHLFAGGCLSAALWGATIVALWTCWGKCPTMGAHFVG